jgi:hypothetical protein
LISRTISLELEVAGMSPAKAETDIECAIVNVHLPHARREAKFNITVSAYDRVSVEQEGLVHADPLVSGKVQVRFFDIQPQSPTAIFPLPLPRCDRVDWTRVKHWLDEFHEQHSTCSRT